MFEGNQIKVTKKSFVDIITTPKFNWLEQQLTFAAINQVNNKNNYTH